MNTDLCVVLTYFHPSCVLRLQHHRMCPDGSRSFSGGECSPDQSAERADGETLLSVTDSDSDLDV